MKGDKMKYNSRFWFVATVVLLLSAGCNNYNLLDRLENPGKRTDTSCGLNCRIFVTMGNYDGNLGGAAGADTICRNDAANPKGSGNGSWKAMLSGGGRRACSNSGCTSAAENIDWVMRPNTPYYRPSGELIAVTNSAGIFIFNTPNAVSTTAVGVWTGLDATWKPDSGGLYCDDWLSNSNWSDSSIGFADSNSVTMIAYSTNIPCNIAYPLYCVEQ
jgi:hypothetical protein